MAQKFCGYSTIQARTVHRNSAADAAGARSPLQGAAQFNTTQGKQVVTLLLKDSAYELSHPAYSTCTSQPLPIVRPRFAPGNLRKNGKL
jgi:hypothetical protein